MTSKVKQQRSNNQEVIVTVATFGGGFGHIQSDLVETLKNEKPTSRVKLKNYAFNTDREDLDILPAGIERVQIGKKWTGGFGAGHDPATGRKSAEEADSKKAIMKMINEAWLIFFCACLGGGTGTGSIEVAIEYYEQFIASQQDLPLYKRKAGLIIVTMPFRKQGKVIWDRAQKALDKLNEKNLPVIVIENDRFLPDTPDSNRAVITMFKEGNLPLAYMLGRMIRSLGKPHNVMNLDWMDIVRNLILEVGAEEEDAQKINCTGAFMGVGYGKGDDRMQKALDKAFSNSLLETKLGNCKKAIISVDCQEFNEMDWNTLQIYLDENRIHEDADWRVGLSSDYKPLAFETDTDPEVAVFVLGVDHVPTSVKQLSGSDTMKSLSPFQSDVPPPTPLQLNGNGASSVELPPITQPDIAKEPIPQREPAKTEELALLNPPPQIEELASQDQSLNSEENIPIKEEKTGEDKPVLRDPEQFIRNYDNQYRLGQLGKTLDEAGEIVKA